LAQVNGRNNLSWDDRLELDVQYVENIRFKNDFRIFTITIFKVIKSEDVIEIMDPQLNIPLDVYRQRTKIKKITEG